jgi:hypothetical protein
VHRADQTGSDHAPTPDIMLRGQPVAKVVPFEEGGETGVKLGSRIGNAIFKGDIVHFDFSDEWELNR